MAKLGQITGNEPVGSPSRHLSTEIIVGALIFVGAIGASVLGSLLISAAITALLPGSDEGALFLVPATVNCSGLLVNPAIFAAVAANHCRRVPAYFIPLTPLLWMGQFVFLWREHVAFWAAPVAVVASCSAGLVLAYWILRRKRRRFRSGAELATNH
jgi:hypothetical protein